MVPFLYRSAKGNLLNVRETLVHKLEEIKKEILEPISMS